MSSARRCCSIGVLAEGAPSEPQFCAAPRSTSLCLRRGLRGRGRDEITGCAVAASIARYGGCPRLIVGLVAGRYITPSPHLFTYGNEVGLRAHVDAVELIGMGYPNSSTTIRHVEPVFVKGSRPAATSVVVCTKRPGSSALWSMGSAYGWAWLSTNCAAVVPARNVGVHAFEASSDSNEYLVLVVVPLAGPGYATIDGINVTHSGRFLDVTERAGTAVRIGVFPSG